MSHFGLNLQRNFCDAYLYANFDIFILSLGLFKKLTRVCTVVLCRPSIEF